MNYLNLRQNENTAERQLRPVHSAKGRTINPEAKRKKILRTAHKLFVNRGYYRVSIPMIVAASGISTGAIYNLFGSKENIARTLYEELSVRFMVSFQKRLAQHTTTYGKLRAFTELVFDLTESDPAMIEYLMFMRHSEFVDDLSPLLSEPFEIVRSIVREGIAANDIKSGDYFACSVTYTGAILRPVMLHLESVLPKPLKEYSEEFINNAWDAIKA
ncbi:TetR/AcrR family transcriptional regulator [uncultured Desulfuromonas sp.]|uniref:TetR/AcrR family transcriptional regulator n=1 Tax=uncultured Desulfuromonas sp. TaxID=181013 RepID=UPI002AAB4A6F|nr:TetR/AcrR family transcriptional regulator [uncultured Desulfuromonas sp.]